MPSIYAEEYQSFITALVDARNRAGLTQQEVATELGKPQSFVSKCESGERRVDAVEAGAFAQIYRCNIGELLKGI